MAAISRPDGIDSEATIDSLDDVDMAMREIAWLRYRRDAIENAARQRCAKIMDEAKAEMIVTELGVSFDERERVLDEAVDSYLADHLETLLEERGEAQSIKLTHGTIGQRKSPDAVVFAKNEAKTIEAIKAKWGMVETIEKLVQTVIDSLSLGQLVTIKIVVAKPSVKSVWDTRHDLRPLLKTLGLKVETGSTNRFVEPVKYVVSPDQ